MTKEMVQILLDQVASGQLNRRRLLAAASAAGLFTGLSGATVDQVLAAGENQAANQAMLEDDYDYIVVGAGSSGSIIAGELSKTGTKVLVVESGGADSKHEVAKAFRKSRSVSDRQSFGGKSRFSEESP